MANVVLIIRNSDLLRSMDEILTNTKSVEKVHELLNKAKTKNTMHTVCYGIGRSLSGICQKN
ncbi:hypothetical protein BWGOE4_09630 [Bacillus mycoides]|uniref:Uncharacterized protein n=1 Tax=Bacillus mycoides TaxID=1405 RepID=A0A1E8BEY6_BACMY|nr:hypothetical protein BWGOE1_57060 [Bacillus mycoides]OFD36085.1 hypothetical protein BWGOE2_55980 [Bacillus mycoides]OFD57378.1 hypothetical protein BWGOE7_55790 [Bacillus mycoides]OFD65930.1 hypothetical protein BWGOE4_09630 [Bacillus mycoides]OFD87673.1 hypothetical protein BWGOE11_56250 [Bacillus mycoides]